MDILPHEKKIDEYIKTIEKLKKQSQDQPLFKSEIIKFEQKLEELKKQVYSELTPWQRVMICRHTNRPHTIDYIQNICEDFEELFGDRAFGDDTALIGGLGTIEDRRFLVIGQEKGNDTESRVFRHFGMMHPEGYRKAMRLMRLAEKFNLPVLSLIDTPGAHPGLEAEERGQGLAIAENLKGMAGLSTPIIVVVIGEGCSGGALGIGVGDVIGMLEHSYYSVITPEGCASILWKNASKNIDSASMLKLNAEDLFQHEIIDAIIKEPLGGAHHDPSFVFKEVKNFAIEQANILTSYPKEILLKQRYMKYRKIGKYLIS